MNGTFHWKNLPMPLRIGLGAAMVVLGILGLFLPFLQGILFITIGLMILAHDVPWARHAVDRLRALRTVARLRGRWGAWLRTFRR